MRRLVEVIVTEHRLYEVQGAETDKQACQIVRERVEQDSPLGLLDTKREITEVGIAPDYSET